jgi:hypothetical protein
MARSRSLAEVQTMAKAAVTLLLAWLWLAGAPPDAAACSCSPPGPPCEAFWKVDAVFVGRVLATAEQPSQPWKAGEPLPFGLGVKVTLAVVERLAGDSGDQPTIEITTGRGGGDCGYRFEVGRSYVVYAWKTEGRALSSTSICTRTRPVNQAADDLRYGRQLGTASQSGGEVSGTLKHVERGPTGQFQVDEPMPDVAVRLTREGWADETRTARDGAFLFTGLAPGDYQVDAESPPGYYTRAYPNTVKITDVRGCAVIVVQGHFDGRLVRPDRTPVPGVTVQARRDEWPGQSSPLEQSALTRDDGSYEIVELPPGRYRLAINADSDFRGRPYRAPTYHPGVAGLHEATAIELAGGQQVTVDALVVPMTVGLVTLRGTVLGVDGRPVAGARVYVSVPAEEGAGRHLGRPAPTGHDGRFVVTVGDEARYRLVGELQTPGSFLKGEALVDKADVAAPVTIRLTPPPAPRR